MLLDQPHRLLDAALLVRADREAEMACLIACSSSVSTILPPVIGTRLTQTRMFTLTSGSARSRDRTAAVESFVDDGHRIALAHVLDRELLAHHRVLGRQVAHQDVLADRRPGARARHVRAAALAVDERLAVAGEDRLAAEHVALDARARCGRRPSACT